MRRVRRTCAVCILSLSPLVGAIAAGCTAILKPSEHTPIVAALFAELFPKYLDPDAYAVVNGGVEETGCLLGMKFGECFRVYLALQYARFCLVVREVVPCNTRGSAL